MRADYGARKFYREPDWAHVCDWTQEQFDAEERVARQQAERNEKRR